MSSSSISSLCNNFIAFFLYSKNVFSSQTSSIVLSATIVSHSVSFSTISSFMSSISITSLCKFIFLFIISNDLFFLHASSFISITVFSFMLSTSNSSFSITSLCKFITFFKFDNVLFSS
ncbi:unnamed protein product [Spodoptera exigua]|nr:unnamed protein product [Spodoptera exigua]